MNIIGINFGHDAAVTLISNGKILRSIEEEKVSRIKQDNGWPSKALNDILAMEGLKPADIDVVAFGSNFYNEIGANEIRYRFTKEDSYKKREHRDRVLAYYLGIGINRFGEKNKIVFEEEVKKKGYTKAKITFFNHHYCHAVGAYYCSPFTPDVVITCDGQGDGESFNYYKFEAKNGLVPLQINGHEVSVGAFYSAITKLLGFRPTRHEGKITGLAAYGKPTVLVDEFLKLFWYNTNGNLERFPGNELDKYWKQYGLEAKLDNKRKINLRTSESAIGVEYAKRFEVLIERIKELTKGFSKEDIAYACQKVAEQIVVEETKRVLAKHFSGKKVKIGLAGGVFANVRINQMIYELDEVENVFVQPAMGDSGLAIGAAIIADITLNNRDINTSQYKFTDTYIGPEYDGQVEGFIKAIKNEANVVKMEQPAKEIAQMMKDNLVVGFWHGSMEWGPRALGRRSMILNTFDKTVNDSVNKRLSRTEFMPFAPSIIDYMMTTYIPKYDSTCPAGDYMTITYDVAPEHHEQLQAVVHVDGTARPQVVKKETNPYYYEIIEEFYKLTGCGAIVNTSFNAHEEPIVSTPEAAYKALKEDRIDVLVLNNYKVEIKK